MSRRRRLLPIWAELLLIGGLITAAGAVILYRMALRDNPARPAVGEAREALSGDAIIEYRASGPKTGVPVLLFPSFARSAADFNELVGALSQAGFHTLAVQPRGIEGSSLPPGEFTYHTYAGDLAAVLDAEGVRVPAHVIGHAYGNRIARTFATDHPERTRAVVLLAAGGVDPTPPAVTEAIGKAMINAYPEPDRREAVAFAFFAEGNTVDEDWMRGWYPHAGLAEQAATPSTPYEEWGHAGSAPILVIQPTEDAAAASGGGLLKEAHPDRVDLVYAEGAGHALLPERPELVARETLRFLSEH